MILGGGNVENVGDKSVPTSKKGVVGIILNLITILIFMGREPISDTTLCHAEG